MYQFLDVFFVVFHCSLIAFNLTGWIWQKTRRLHLYVISGTVFSWIGLGVVCGWGYCPCTDWHWQIKRKLGETDLPASYVKYYLDAISGFSWNAFLVDSIVAVSGVVVLMISGWLNYRDRKKIQQ